MKKLQLKKSIVARLGQNEMNQLGGNGITQGGICDRSKACPVSNTCIANCVPTIRECAVAVNTDRCLDTHLCITGQSFCICTG